MVAAVLAAMALCTPLVRPLVVELAGVAAIL